ncbi:Uncharacterised protein [Bordetella pertussis]|nr:Uncharacterised protein [Bordetella pertussis]CPM56139.1 Uncharacterised protein [Bordetella pertussis]CPO79907.1 Uncharacterised protein [Bordetella pertussis]
MKRAMRSDSTAPGAMALQRTRCSANSTAIERVSACTPPLAAV